MFDGADPTDRYAARIVFDRGDPKLLGFRWFDRSSVQFIGEIADPVRIESDETGQLSLANDKFEKRGDV